MGITLDPASSTSATHLPERRSVIHGHDALIYLDIMNAAPRHRPSGWSRRVAAMARPAHPPGPRPPSANTTPGFGRGPRPSLPSSAGKLHQGEEEVINLPDRTSGRSGTS